MNRTAAIGFTAALAIIGLAGWLLTASFQGRDRILLDNAPQELPTPEEVDADALGAIAAESCVCARSGADRDCWAQYRERVSDFDVDSIAAACLPFTIENDCAMTTEGEVCWLTGFGGTDVCTSDEAAAVEHAFKTAPAGKENEAVAEVVARIRAGEKIAVEPDEGGCA